MKEDSSPLWADVLAAWQRQGVIIIIIIFWDLLC